MIFIIFYAFYAKKIINWEKVLKANTFSFIVIPESKVE